MNTSETEVEETTPAAEAPAAEFDGSHESMHRMVDEAAKAQEEPTEPTPTEAEAAAAAATPAEVKRAWKALNGEVEVSDLKGLTAEQLLAMTFEYQANGKPQRRTFDEIVRNAQQGHYNAERMQQLQADRQKALEMWKQREATATELQGAKQTWERALNAAVRGDFAPLQAAVDAYQAGLQEMQSQPQQQQMVPLEQVEAERRGMEVYNTTVLPKAEALAQQYGLPAADMAKAIMVMLDREPQEFLTPARFQQIVDVELPAEIEAWKAGQQPAGPSDAVMQELAAMRAELAALKASGAEKHNASLESVHRRRKAAPPAAPALPASGVGSESPDFASADEAREWLNGLRL